MDIYIEEYLQYMQTEHRASGNTLQAYRSDLTKLGNFLGNNGIYDWNKVTIINLNSYILALEKNGTAASTVSRNISSIKSFFAWMFRRRLINDEPSVYLKHPRVEPKSPDIIESGELDRLFSAIDMTTAKGVRDNAIFRIMCNTGIRTQELLELNITDVNLMTGTLMIYTQGHERAVCFDDSVKSSLMLYIGDIRNDINKEGNSRLFLNMRGQAMSRQGLWKIIKEYGGRIGMTITPQMFRHTCAANMAAEGSDLAVIKRKLGVAGINAMEKYSEYAPD